MQENNILILGGGTGALTLNQLIAQTIHKLSKETIINHVTGKNKAVAVSGYENYHQYNLLTQDYYSKISQSELVISRAGLGALLELAYLKKPAIIIPLSSSQQEKNAEYFVNQGAIVYLKQKELKAEQLAGQIAAYLKEKNKLKTLSNKIHSITEYGGAEKLAEIALKLLL